MLQLNRMSNGVMARSFVIAVIFFVFFCLPVILFFNATNNVYAAVPNVINFQGRLENSSGVVLGGSTGTNYDFKFSIWDSLTGGTRLWPVAAPASTTLVVTNGVFSVGLGDTSLGFSALNLSFNSSTPYYLEIVAYNTTSTQFETLTPRQL